MLFLLQASMRLMTNEIQVTTSREMTERLSFKLVFCSPW
jgi:hypothetical protein